MEKYQKYKTRLKEAKDKFTKRSKEKDQKIDNCIKIIKQQDEQIKQKDEQIEQLLKTLKQKNISLN